MNTANKWHNKFANFTKALRKLEQAVAQKQYNDLEKAGLIQTFEFTFELAWKTLQSLLQSRGYNSALGPRDVLKEAYKNSLIDNGEIWLDALDNRNLLAHNYDEPSTNTGVSLIKEKYFPELKKLLTTLTPLVSASTNA
jgi:nucleotidyltransferase substrate binding protein (TIGR01987 family)